MALPLESFGQWRSNSRGIETAETLQFFQILGVHNPAEDFRAAPLHPRRREAADLNGLSLIFFEFGLVFDDVEKSFGLAPNEGVGLCGVQRDISL